MQKQGNSVFLNINSDFSLNGKNMFKNVFSGVFMFNIKITQPKYSFNNSFYYIHQNTIFNDSGMDIFDMNKDRTWFSKVDDKRFYKAYNIMAFVQTES